MQVLIDNFGLILDGFVKTLWLLLFAGLIALVLGTLLVALRVSPVAVMRAVGTSYINVVRNTPLLLIVYLFGALFPVLGYTASISSYIDYSFITATIALGMYAAAFVCEALRAGINSIPVGQAEAARSLGMTFGQSMSTVILPQAFRAAIPPLASTYIALAKNTSVALAIGVTEAAFAMKKLNNEYATGRSWIFFGFAVGYILIVWAIAAFAHGLERQAGKAR
ncbi:MAG: amino acid ABC transporter permease [Nocardioidaceae bacterium]|nr:amino acid ABC transporter permease [Nocardioidaceae bacterium]